MFIASFCNISNFKKKYKTFLIVFYVWWELWIWIYWGWQQAANTNTNIIGLTEIGQILIRIQLFRLIFANTNTNICHTLLLLQCSVYSTVVTVQMLQLSGDSKIAIINVMNCSPVTAPPPPPPPPPGEEQRDSRTVPSKVCYSTQLQNSQTAKLFFPWYCTQYCTVL